MCVKTIVRCVCDSTGWPRCIGCRQLQVFFRKRATIYRALLRKNDQARSSEAHRAEAAARHQGWSKRGRKKNGEFIEGVYLCWRGFMFTRGDKACSWSWSTCIVRRVCQEYRPLHNLHVRGLVQFQHKYGGGGGGRGGGDGGD